MAFFDTEEIINGTPEKRIINAYRKMSNSYTEESAEDFYNVYTKQPFSAVMENPKLVFSEAYKGTDFIKTIFTNPSFCAFEYYDQIISDMTEFLETNGSNMHKSQKEVYTEALDAIKETYDGLKSSRVYSEYIRENVGGDIEKDITDLAVEMAYNKDEEKDYEEVFDELFKEATVPEFMLYMPYATEAANNSSEIFTSLSSRVKDLMDTTPDPEHMKGYFEAVVAANKLTTDKYYVEALGSVQNRDRMYINGLKGVNLFEAVKDIAVAEDKVNPVDVIHVTAESAINSIFDDIIEESLEREEEIEERANLSLLEGLAYEATLDILYQELGSEDPSNTATGYSLFNKEGSLKEAFESLNSKYEGLVSTYKESEDISDDDISNMEKDVNGEDVGKKPQAPPVNTDKDVQSLDKEAKKFSKRAGRKKFGFFGKLKRGPKNLQERIQQEINKYDEMDDKRRKEYFTRPGFRKKWFRNLKLALLYGGAATYKLSMIPVVAMCRHFSKQKDRRMRNELVRELETEIKVSEEKINDANANGDQKEKYRLMRIRDQLTAERNRVIVNSKYI